MPRTLGTAATVPPLLTRLFPQWYKPEPSSAAVYFIGCLCLDQITDIFNRFSLALKSELEKK
jgi:hypothetical protein